GGGGGGGGGGGAEGVAGWRPVGAGAGLGNRAAPAHLHRGPDRGRGGRAARAGGGAGGATDGRARRGAIAMSPVGHPRVVGEGGRSRAGGRPPVPRPPSSPREDAEGAA